MYRLLHVPEEHSVLIHPVPDCHARYNKRRSFFYILVKDIESAEIIAHRLLECQKEREEWLWQIHFYGPDPHFKYAHNWRPGRDAVVGRRILERSE